MKKQRLRFLLLTLVGILIYSCQNDDEFLESQTTSEIAKIENELKYGEKIILGKKLKNPYSVENMKRAFQNIKSSSNFSARTSNVEISTSHYYVKFIPKNSEELGIIEKDSSLIAYDYPLDYEILQMGDYYHDPEVPIDQPTYHYASIPVGKEIPKGVEYVILSNLFIPDEEDIPDDFKELLTDEALRITDNLKEEKSVENKTDLFSRRSKWRPAGTIKVWDDNIGQTTTTTRVFSHWEYYDCGGNGDEILPIAQNTEQSEKIIKPIDNQCRRAIYRYITTTTNGSYVPVEGVKVRARRWFTTHTGITNAQGYYSCSGRFRRPANYKIKWKRHDFSIRWSQQSSAKYNGPKKRGDWNLNIKGGTQEYYATIFRAAHHYYYKDIKGLRRPPQNSFWRTQMKIRAYKQNVSDEGSLGTHSSFWRAFGLWSPLKIYTYQRPAIDTYSTVIHELAHASHWNINRSDFRNSAPIVKESWARGVERELTRMVYSSYQPSYSRLRYTGIVEDLIDGFKTKTSYYFWTESNPWGFSARNYSDKVSDYTLRQIEDALNGQKSWTNWKINIKNRYDNETKENLEDSFNFWNTQ